MVDTGEVLTRVSNSTIVRHLVRPSGSEANSVSMRRLVLIVVWLVALVAACLAMPDGTSAHPGHQHSIMVPEAAVAMPVAGAMKSAPHASLLEVAHSRGADLDGVVDQSSIAALEPRPKPCLGGCCNPMNCMSCCVAVVGQGLSGPVAHATAALMNGAEPSIGEGLRPPTDCEPPRRLV